MTEEPDLEHREKKRGGCVVAVLVLVPLIYILSPVFVELTMQTLPEPVASAIEPVLWVVYAPIRWAVMNIEWVSEFYGWQLELFGL